jgi:glycosyltransferase involved in cell wall biosynthesis
MSIVSPMWPQNMPNKVLYLVPDLLGPPGGIALYCRLVCQALAESDVLVNVLALRDKPGQALNGVNYQGCGGSRPTFVRRAVQQVLRQHPALIIVGHPNFATLGALLGMLGRARVVTWLYGIDAWTPLSAARRWGLRHSDRLIAISQYTARRAVEVNTLPADKLRVLYNCLDTQFAAQSPLDRTPDTRWNLLTVGRLSLAEQYKGHDMVIRALPAVLAQFPEVIYHIVGDGDWRPTLETLAQQMGVAQVVRFHGRVSDEELRQRYAEASIFIMPSTQEGFGFVFAEAMAYGVPAIGGNVDATPEVIKDGDTGYCVNPTSSDEIAQAITRLLSDEALRQRLGQQAARHVREKFGFVQFQQQLLAYLREIASLTDENATSPVCSQ